MKTNVTTYSPKIIEYSCPKHGKLDSGEVFIFNFSGGNERAFCMKCLADLIESSLPPLKGIVE